MRQLFKAGRKAAIRELSGWMVNVQAASDESRAFAEAPVLGRTRWRMHQYMWTCSHIYYTAFRWRISGDFGVGLF